MPLADDHHRRRARNDHEWIGPNTGRVILGAGIITAVVALGWFEHTGQPVNWRALGEGLGTFILLAVAVHVLYRIWAANRQSLRDLDQSIDAASQTAQEAEQAEKRFLARGREDRAD